MKNVFFGLCSPGDAATVPAATTTACLPHGPIVTISVWSLLHPIQEQMLRSFHDGIGEGWVQFDLFNLLL